MDSVRGVRTALVVPRETRRRNLDEQILARFPTLVRIVASAWSRLPPPSRVRRVVLSRIMRQGCEAANRRDFELLVLLFDPDIELELAVGGFAPPDLPPVSRGHEGFLRAWQAMLDSVEDFRLELDEVVDFGDRLFTSGRYIGHGSASGAPFTQPVFQVYTVRRGLVISQMDFTERDRALEAVGLRE